MDLATQGGEIVVGPDGLTGDFAALDLIAKRLRIGGPVAPDAGIAPIRGMAGTSAVTLDGTVTDPAWLRRDPLVNGTSPEIAVDISSPILSGAGAIRLIVTDAGAGVRLAGAMNAGLGGFSLTSSGHVTMADAQIRAQGPVDIRAGSITAGSGVARSDLESRESGVTLSATGVIAVSGARIAGKTRSVTSFEPLGAVTISGGGVSFMKDAAGQGVDLVAFADDLAVMARDALADSGTQYRSARDIAWSAGSVLTLSGVDARAGQDMRLLAGTRAVVSASRLNIVRAARLEAPGLTFDAAAGVTSVTSDQAGLVLVAGEGGIENRGSVLSGRSRTSGDADSQGAVTLLSRGDIRAVSLDKPRLARFEGLNDDVVLRSDGAVVLQTAKVKAFGDVTVKAGTRILNETALTPGGLDQSAPDTLGQAPALSRKGGSAHLVYGRPLIADEMGEIIAAGTGTLLAPLIVNRGAFISGASLSLSGGAVIHQSLVTGEAYYKRSCIIFCRVKGQADAALLTGRIDASGRITIQASEAASVAGGLILAGQGLAVTAPRIDVLPVYLPLFVRRPAGLYSFFSGSDGWLTFSWSGAFFYAQTGNITLEGEAVALAGSDLRAAAGQVNLPARVNRIEKPYAERRHGWHALGFGSGW
jgi:hypothetical protein